MLKRLKPPQGARRQASWPELSDSQETGLFIGRPPLRRLVAMVDAHLLSPAEPGAPLTKQALLTEMLDSDLVELYRFDDNGPPSDVKPLSVPDSLAGGPSFYAGWAVGSPDRGDGWTVAYSQGDGQGVLSGVDGDGVELAEADHGSGAYMDMDPAVALEQRKADTSATMVASQCLEADLFVTGREYPALASWEIDRHLLICSVEDALPILGLYLRRQGEFLVRENYRYNRGLYYLVGAWEILAGAWRWTSACSQHDSAVGEETLLPLAHSAIERFRRSLEARDRLHVALNQPQHNDTRRELLAELDELLLCLMGAFDATARVANHVLDLCEPYWKVGWQKKSWVRKVDESSPNLAAVVGPAGDGLQTLLLLSRLRNTIHGEALHSMAVADSSHPDDSLVRIPTEDRGTIVAAIEALGGASVWGLTEVGSRGTHIDPHVLVEQLMPRVVALLNKLMIETPVEHLPHVRLTPSHCAPPTEDSRPLSRWNPSSRLSIRWQLGF